MDRNDEIQFDGPTLSPDDIRVIDSLFQSAPDWSAASFKSNDGTDHRASQVTRLFHLFEAYPVDDFADADAEALITRTMERIRQTPARKSAATNARRVPNLRFRPAYDAEMIDTRGPIRVNWRDILGIAAVILILVSVAAPMLDNARVQARRKACATNLMSAAMGFGQYATDNAGFLPKLSSSPPEGNWLRSRANSSNLFLLAKSGYASLATLACPSNENAVTDPAILTGDNWPSRGATSFAYQNQFGPDHNIWKHMSTPMAVLADRNPHVDASCAEQLAQPRGADAISPCHDSRQNMLISDGSVVQSTRPYHGSDHIFLPEDYEVAPNATITYVGNEVPVSPTDSMLIQ